MLNMTAEDELTDHARDLLDMVRGRGGEWISRTELAKAAERKRLAPYDVELLQRLVDKGLIEIRRREVDTPIGYAYDYRAL